MDPITANYLMDYLFFSRDDELFRYYKKVSNRKREKERWLRSKGLNNSIHSFLPPVQF